MRVCLPPALSALALRLLTATGALAMALGAARLLGPEGFGTWASMLALATLASTAAVLGQDVAILRAGAGDAAPDDAAGRSAGIVCAAGLGIAGALLGLAAACAAADRRAAAAIALGAAILTLPLAQADVARAAAQARGWLWGALGARDILWRLAVAALAVAAAMAAPGAPPIGPVGFALAAAGLLTLCIALQLRLTRGLRGRAMLRPRRGADRTDGGRMLAALAAAGSGNLSVLVVAAALGPASAGAFFAAQRIAQLAALPLHAARSAEAGAIAAAHAGGRSGALAPILARMRRATILPTLVLGGAAVLAGDRALALFDVAPGAAWAALPVLVGALAIQALGGPTSQLMMLCGGHRAALRQTLAIEGAALAALPFAVLAAGATGAALTLAGAALLGNLAGIIWTRRTLGVDPGIGALILPLRGAAASAASAVPSPDLPAGLRPASAVAPRDGPLVPPHPARASPAPP